MYSRNITNLFLAGRVLSCSHISFGSLRNMASLGYCGQAAGAAAALCVWKKLRPADLSRGESLKTLQQTLLRAGQHIRGLRHADPDDFALKAKDFGFFGICHSGIPGRRAMDCLGARFRADAAIDGGPRA